MPTEENQNVQTSGNPVTGDQSSNDNVEINNAVENTENNLDIDLNLEGLDIPVESKNDSQMDLDIEKMEELNPISEVVDTPDTVADTSNNDWLVEEDKKVEELQQDVVKDNNIEKNNIENNVAEIKLDEIKVDVPVESSIDSVESLFDSPDVDTADNLDVSGDISMPDTMNAVDTVELHTENLGEDVIENNQGDIVSDTGDMNSDKSGYVPNEHDFGQITDVLKTADAGGSIDLGSLDQNNDEGKNLDLGVEKENLNTSMGNDNGYVGEGLDLDSMISDFETTESSIENKPEEKINIEKPQEELKSQEEVKSDIEEEIDDTQIDMGSVGIVAGAVKYTETVAPVATSVEVPVEVVNAPVAPVAPVEPIASVPQVAPPVVAAPVTNNPVIDGLPAGAVIVSGPPQMPTKGSHAGLKIFVFIVVLLVGGAFMLNKMYPEEIGDIMSAINGDSGTVIEYEDSVDGDVENVDDLEKTVVDTQDDKVDVETSDIEDENNDGSTDEDMINTGVLEEELDEIEELDPDSLAAQLEDNADNLSGDVDIEEKPEGKGALDIPKEGGVPVEEEHSAGGVDDIEEFNAFEGIEEVIDAEVGEYDDLLDQLQVYQDEGTDYYTWGRELNNTTAMKYGLYISEKSESVINDIENGVEIDTTKVDGYFAQFDTYIDKLDSLRDEIDGEGEEDLDPSLVDEQNTDQPESTGAVQ